MKILLLLLNIFVRTVFISPVLSDSLKETAKLTGNGFHRNLEINYESLPVGDCKVALKLNVPAGLYLDPDELEKRNEFDFCMSKVPRVEAQQKNAESFEIFVFPYSVIQKTKSLSLPVHARYHSPSSDTSFTVANISEPTFLTNCSKLCSNHLSLKIPCERTETSDEWCALDKTSSFATFNIFIPVGNIAHLPVVVFVTSFVTLFGAVSIMCS